MDEFWGRSSWNKSRWLTGRKFAPYTVVQESASTNRLVAYLQCNITHHTFGQLLTRSNTECSHQVHGQLRGCPYLLLSGKSSFGSASSVWLLLAQYIRSVLVCSLWAKASSSDSLHCRPPIPTSKPPWPIKVHPIPVILFQSHHSPVMISTQLQ
jgi:hypothetical protein